MILKLKCRTCLVEYTVEGDIETPPDVIGLECNWCPNCQNTADAPYEEYPIKKESKPIAPKIPKQQLKLF